MSKYTPSPQSVVVLERAEYERLIGVAEDLISNTQDPGTEALAAVYCARRILDAPAPSSLAGGKVSRAVACVGQVANGAQVAEVYGGEWCLDPALEFRAHLRAILAALSPEAPAREGRVVREALEAADQCIADMVEIYASGGSMAVLDLAVKSLRDDAGKRVRKALDEIKAAEVQS